MIKIANYLGIIKMTIAKKQHSKRKRLKKIKNSIF